MVDNVEVRFVSDPRWLRLVRVVVERFCRTRDVQPPSADGIKLAVDEVLSNIMRHAYRGDTTRPIILACSRSGDSVQVEICDDGREFDPFAQTVPPPDELRSGGRGLFLIRTAVDGHEYARVDGWNRVRLSKRLAPAAGRGER